MASYNRTCYNEAGKILGLSDGRDGSEIMADTFGYAGYCGGCFDCWNSDCAGCQGCRFEYVWQPEQYGRVNSFSKLEEAKETWKKQNHM